MTAVSLEAANRTIYIYRDDLTFIKTFATQNDYHEGDVLRLAARGEYEIFDVEEVTSESGQVELRCHARERA
jgi:hypothetical protein